MDIKADDCFRCRGCCKFAKEDIYFAPIFTKEEAEKAKKFKVTLTPHKDSGTVFQIKLVKSKMGDDLYICPLLDEKGHLCKIYHDRPFDCRSWPFLFMKDKKGKKTFLACFDKDACPVTDRMNAKEFEGFKNATLAWIEKEKAYKLIKEHPALIWDYEPYTFVVSEIKNNE